MAASEERRALVAGVIYELGEIILAEGAGVKFRSAAAEKAKGFSADDLSLLRSFFHDPPTESPLYDYRKYGLGGWLSACQFAIFEIVYNIGEEALPFIREIAWGEYDWTQGNAIELLIRMVAAGVQREEIIAEIEREFPHIRHEASLYAIQPLIPKLDDDAELKRVFERLMGIEYFRDAYDELTYVDPDPYNFDKEVLHASVVSSSAGPISGHHRKALASLECEGVTYPDFKDMNGRVRVIVDENCRLVKRDGDDFVPVEVSDVLSAEKIAIGHYSSKFIEDGAAIIYPSSVGVLR